MSAYLTTLLTSTTSRYTTLRRTLLPGADESDGDTEDDSHIARCLRAYYTEKNRPLPDWLPPDPKKPLPPVQPQYPQDGYGYGAGGGGRYGQGSSGSGGSMGRSGDPYDGAQGSTSLRAGRMPPAQAAAQQAGRGERYAAGGAASARLTPGGGRPLPSSREGSMQGRFGDEGAGGMARPGMGAAGAGSTQERLKARLFGGGAAAGAAGGGGAGAAAGARGSSGGMR